MEFKIQICQTWKVTEAGLGPGKSWKINQMVPAFWTCVHVFGLYIHCHCITYLDLLFSIIMNCVAYSMVCATRFLLSLIYLLNVN